LSPGIEQFDSPLMLASSTLITFAPLYPVALVLHIVVCWLIADALRRIPERYRFQEPKMVWLLLIPLFNLYWNFRVLPSLAESFQVCFYSHGVGDVEDCGESLARAYCWLALCAIIPCLGFLSLAAALVVLVLFLIQIDRLKKRIALLPSS
jgi:hypothetical protein